MKLTRRTHKHPGKRTSSQLTRDASHLRILLVDEDPFICSIYRNALERRGHVVEEAADGSEALEKLQTSNCDVMVLDIMMPMMNGTRLLRLLEGAKTHPRILMMSSLSKASTMENALLSGADYYLVKTDVTIRDVVHTVEMLGAMDPVLADEN